MDNTDTIQCNLNPPILLRRGSVRLDPELDEYNDTGEVQRCLLKLSDGGADAIHVREFDLVKKEFVPAAEKPFILGESKSSISYLSRDVVLVGTKVGDEKMTDSGYPINARRWVRGTPVAAAPITYAGVKEDVSVGSWINDQRTRGGKIYEFQHRSLTFYTSTYNARVISAEHLLAAPTDVCPPEFKKLEIQEDADVCMFGDIMVISLRSEWTINGNTYPTGSLLATPFASFSRDPNTSK